jgi:hypothetical protein
MKPKNREKRNECFVMRYERFRFPDTKPLKSLRTSNRGFRGIVCFQVLNRLFVSHFRRMHSLDPKTLRPANGGAASKRRDGESHGTERTIALKPTGGPSKDSPRFGAIRTSYPRFLQKGMVFSTFLISSHHRRPHHIADGQFRLDSGIAQIPDISRGDCYSGGCRQQRACTSPTKAEPPHHAYFRPSAPRTPSRLSSPEPTANS